MANTTTSKNRCLCWIKLDWDQMSKTVFYTWTLGFFTFHQIGAKISPNGRRFHQIPRFHWISADLVPRFPSHADRRDQGTCRVPKIVMKYCLYYDHYLYIFFGLTFAIATTHKLPWWTVRVINYLYFSGFRRTGNLRLLHSRVHSPYTAEARARNGLEHRLHILLFLPGITNESNDQ